jgi:hypothetical protein
MSEISYTLEQFCTGEGISLFRRSREKNADLSFAVFYRTGQQLTVRSIEALERGFGPDQVTFNVPPELEVKLFVDSPQQAGSLAARRRRQHA